MQTIGQWLCALALTSFAKSKLGRVEAEVAA